MVKTNRTSLLLFAAGVASVVTGVSMWSVEAGFILAGIGLVLLGVLNLDVADDTAQPGSRYGEQS